MKWVERKLRRCEHADPTRLHTHTTVQLKVQLASPRSKISSVSGLASNRIKELARFPDLDVGNLRVIESECRDTLELAWEHDFNISGVPFASPYSPCSTSSAWVLHLHHHCQTTASTHPLLRGSCCFLHRRPVRRCEKPRQTISPVPAEHEPRNSPRRPY